MANHRVLPDQVLEALDMDPYVTVACTLQVERETFVIGARNTHAEPRDTKMFVIALEDPRSGKEQRGPERLRRLKESLCMHSPTKGIVWYGLATTIETALRISRGEMQMEPPDSS